MIAITLPTLSVEDKEYRESTPIPITM